MLKRLQGVVIGLLIGTLLTGSLVFAKTGTETIEALYNNIKIYVDGVKIDSKDVNGNAVEPFIYNGTTYLPVRAVGEAIGKQVSWDGETQSVYLGEKPGDVQYLMDVCPPYRTQQYDEYTLVNGKSFSMSGKKYTNGFFISNNWGTGGYAIFNLNGKYNSITLELGPVDGHTGNDSEVNFFVDDKLVKSYTVNQQDLSKKVTIPLKGGMQLKIEKLTHYGVTTGFGNIVVE